jgi:hypothetical protein
MSFDCDDLARIHDVGRVEGALDATHQIDLYRGSDAGQLIAFQLTDAVFGRDRAIERQHDPVDDLVDLVPSGEEGGLVGTDGLGDVVVNVAVS